MTDEAYDWRSEHGLKTTYFYKKRFAFFPTKCSDGKTYWLKPYYVKYRRVNTNLLSIDNGHGHVDRLETLSEDSYIVVILSAG